MKRAVIIVIIACISNLSIAQDVSKLDAKNGFRDAVFGTNVNEFKNLVKVEEGGGKVFYNRTTDVLKIGDYQLESINYGFYKDRLFCVIIVIEGISNSRGVLGVLQAAYGKGNQDNEYIEEYFWLGSIVYMSYDENSITHNSKIYISSNEIAELMESDKEKAAKDAAQGL